MLRVYSQKVLKLKESQRAIIANGRVLGPFDENEAFTIEDFSLLERFSSSVYLDGITKTLTNSDEEDDGKFTIQTPVWCLEDQKTIYYSFVF